MTQEAEELHLIEISLSKATFKTFLRLKQDVGRLVYREALLYELGLTEMTLRQHIKQIRRVLGQSAIKSVHSTGYILDRIQIGGVNEYYSP